MARLVRLTVTDPLKIDPAALPPGQKLSICTCGISAKFPLCDGAHKRARLEQPGMLYTYSADGTTVLSVVPDPHAPGPSASTTTAPSSTPSGEPPRA
jgi:CDGSH-type Zn-finger protein